MRFGLFFSTAIAAAALTGAAHAQTHQFRIDAQPLPAALVDFAIQAGVSVETRAAAACGSTRGLTGAFGVEAGLTRLLAGTGCAYRRTADGSVVIMPAPRVAAPTPTAPIAPPPPPEPAPPTTVDTVLVTSPKRTIGLSRAPYAISAVSGDALSETGEASVSDLAAHVAGLTITNLGPGRNKLFVRGLADGPLTGRTQSVVGIYLDDARLIYNAPDPDLRLTDVERVEVLRGPQGSLYGAGSIGGVMQIVTRAPEQGVFGGYVNLGATVVNDGDTGSVVEGAVNLPLIGDRVAARIAGYREETGGYIDDPLQGLDDVDRAVRQGLRTSLSARITPNWRARVTFVDQTIHADDTHYAETMSGPYDRALSLREPHRNDFDAILSVVEGDLGFARFKISNALQNHELETRYDATLSAPLFYGPTTGPAAFEEENEIETIVTEATLVGRPGGRLTWLLGAFSSEYSQVFEHDLTDTASPDALYLEEREDHIDEYAVYGEATWNVTDRLRITAGGRYYNIGVETEAETSQPVLGMSTTFSGERTDNGFAPKVLAEYDFSPTILLYVQAAEGYRAGGFNTSGLAGQVFNAPDGGAQPFRSFGSDELISYEAGARLRLLDGRLRVRIAAFRAEWEDIQSDRLLPSGLPFTANIGSGENNGVELESTWRAGPWQADLDLFLNDPEITTPDPSFPIPEDIHFPAVPSVLANVGLRREWALPGGQEAYANLQVGYVGASTLTFDASLTRRMGGYLTSRLSGGVSGDVWRLTGYIDNLFGDDGDTFAYGNPFRLRMRDQNTPQRPTTVGVNLGRNF